MENLVFGIIIFAVCIPAYILAYRKFIKNNVAVTLLLVMICGLLLRIYTATDLYIHAWDERYHALVAKNLMKHPLRPTLYDDPILPYDFKNCTAYPNNPDSFTLESIAEKGYDIFIRNNSMDESELIITEQNDIILTGHNTIYRRWQPSLP